jgi:hypothetical protein
MAKEALHFVHTCTAVFMARNITNCGPVNQLVDLL